MQRTKRLVRLALTLALACGVVLTGTAAAARATPPQPAADQILKLTPAAAVAQVGKPIRYTAVAVDDNGGRDDLTTLTVFRFSDPGLCRQTDKAGEVICDKPGAYTVTGEVDLPRLTSDPVDLEVVLEPVSPSIESVDRNPTPPNRDVTVKGNTGTCEHRGTLSLVGAHSSRTVAGRFTTSLSVPPGTAPGDHHQLLLSVFCPGGEQEARFNLVVENQPPTPGNDEASTVPGKPVTIPVTRNDTDPDDPDGYATRLEEASPGPSHGTVAVQGDQIVYSPDGTFDSQGDRFTYASCDVVGRAATDCGTATVTVVRTPPRPRNDEARTMQGEKVLIPVTGNDDDPDDTLLHVSREPKEPGAKAMVDADQPGSIEYTPPGTFIGDDTFEYDYCPIVISAVAPPTCTPATVTVHVERPRVAPRIDSVARNPSPPNREVTVKGATGTCDRAARLILDSQPKAATPVAVTGGQDGAFEATLKVPPGTFVDSYRLELQVVCDGKAEVVGRELRVANQPPRAVDDPAATTEGDPVTIDVTANDTDPDGDDGYDTALETAKPARGRLKAEPGKPLVYTPEGGFTGVDGFTYRICDIVDAAGAKDCGTATVTVTVERRKPVPVDDPGVETVRDRAVVVDVMKNDRDPDASRLQARQPARPGAKAGEQADGTVRYTPEAGFTGVDTFQYDYCAGSGGATAAQGACPSATVTVTVNTPDPVPVDDPDETTMRDRPAVLDVMGNDRDPDPARLRVLDRPAPEGTAVAQPDGTIRYTPEAGEAGEDRFRYDYCGGSVNVTAARGPCPSATVTVTVTDVPVISSIEPASTPPGKPVQVVGSTGSCNRSGTLELQGAGVAVTVAADQAGAFTTGLIVPAGTFPGPYRLELRVDCRGQLQRADASLTVTNKAPVAADDLDSTTRDQAVRIDVTGNDRDPDDPDGYRTLVLVTRQPDHGSAQEQNLAVDYTPERGFVGADQFEYSLCDDVLNTAGEADCGRATVTVTVTDTPIISSVAPGSTPPGRPVEVVGSTGSCNRSGTLILHGTVDIPMDVAGDENGGFAVALTVPAGTFPGSYRLELRVDCNGLPQLAGAGLTVTNQPPAPVDDQTSTLLYTPVAVEVTANDGDPDDPDGYAAIVLVSDPPSHGTAEAQPDNQVRYTPDKGFSGQDRFRYSLCDDVLNANGTADCGSATVTVRVDPRACVPPAGASSPLHVDPVKGGAGTRLRITATVDRGLVACPLRFLLGGTPLGPDVRVRSDGSISEEREVPGNARPGPGSLRLATLTALTVAETPFEVVPVPTPAGLSLPLRLLVGVGALLAGALARAAFRRWRLSRQERRAGELPDDLRAEPHTSPVEVAVEPVHDATRTFTVRLEPHPDPGNQTLREVT